MKAQVIPAQITTVEDRIAGSLSLTQILILLSPVFFASLVFTVFPPAMKLAVYKLAVSLLFATLAVTLSVRIKDRLIVQWLGVLLRYNLRPKYYVFDKNDPFMREVSLPEEKNKKANAALALGKKRKPVAATIADLVRLEEVLRSGNSKAIFSADGKGGLRVALEKAAAKG